MEVSNIGFILLALVAVVVMVISIGFGDAVV